MRQKVEFGSAAWLDLAEQALSRAAAAAGPAIAGQSVRVSEVFAGAPAHIANAGADLAWAFQVADGRVTVWRNAVEGADLSLRADYSAALLGVRAIVPATAEAIAARDAARRERVAAGLVDAQGGLEHLSLPLRQVLVEMHNVLAEVTA